MNKQPTIPPNHVPAARCPPTCVKAAEEVADGDEAVGCPLQQGGQAQRRHLDGCRDGQGRAG